MNTKAKIDQNEPTPSRLSRRAFLSTTGQAAAGLALASPLAWLTGCATTSTASREANWSQLERTLRGKILRPNSLGYRKATNIWNLRYASIRPAGVAMAADAQDVATAIKWARDNNVPLTARSGGHNFGGYSTTTGLVINLNGMTRLAADPRAGTMTAFGAATNAGVAAAGKPHGMALAGGQCPTVGVPGSTLGGGLGFYSREHGLIVDSLLSSEMVTADGQIVTASPREHPDLYWAIRGGGGGNFGINTSFTFRPFTVPERVAIFSIEWEGDACIAAFLAMQEVVLHSPFSLGCVAAFEAEAQADGSVLPRMTFVGQYVESQEAARRLFAPAIRRVRPHQIHFEEKTFWNAKSWLGDDAGDPNAFAERSRFHTRPVTENALQTILHHLRQAPVRPGKFSAESVFFALGGTMRKVGPTETAYAHRKSTWLQTFNCSWDLRDPQEEIARINEWQNGFFAAMRAYASDHSFQNFIDPQLVNPLHAYYGENLPRLTAIKRHWDPDKVFTFPQGIGI